MNLAGRPLARYALETLRGCREIEEIILVVAPEDVERARCSLLQSDGVARGGGAQTERVVAGGHDRMASVRAGLAEVRPTCELVLIHDGARPFLSAELLRRCLKAAAVHGAVAAGVPATDTPKQVGPEDVITATLNRSRVWMVQTPQVFPRELLMEAHERAARESVSSTDDAFLVERLGHPVHVVMGDPKNIKITWPEDLLWAEHFVEQKEHKRERRVTIRSGIGYDAHRCKEDRPLVLGGVRFEGEPGLLGHSDADVVCHAICDSLLGALGAGDIGQHFPDSDVRYAGISSLSLLTRVAAMVSGDGWEIENVDAVVIAEAPRIGPRIPQMRRALAGAMGIEAERVNVKAKTTEGLGFVGRREGVASEAICMLRRKD